MCSVCCLVTGTCRSPFFDHRRMETMQPARHPEITETKESERQKVPQLLSKMTKAEHKTRLRHY